MFKGLGWRKDRLDHRDAIYRLQLPAHAKVDETIDYKLATLPAMDFPIYDQRQTNSCVANATGRNVEYLMRAQGVFDFHPSRNFIYWVARAAIGEQNKDNGCEIRDAFNCIAAYGVPHEPIWPFEDYYIKRTPTRVVFRDAVDHKALTRQPVPQKLDHLLHCLAHRLPIVFGTNVFPSWDDPGETGRIPLPAPGEKSTGGHAIMITGWHAATKSFQFVNSWGAEWGERGFGYLPADYVLNPDLSSDFWSAFLMSKTEEEKRRGTRRKP